MEGPPSPRSWRSGSFMLSCPVMDPGVVEAAVLLRVGMGSADTNPKRARGR